MILFILKVWLINAFKEHFNKVENKEITPTLAEKVISNEKKILNVIKYLRRELHQNAIKCQATRDSVAKTFHKEKYSVVDIIN